MSPQFVDFNADGHTDIVVGTFDGSPHVSFGSNKGFTDPTHILDKDGQRILINQFWNFETKKWDNATRCNPEGHELPNGHLTSAIAFDWNGNGVWDLVLGDYDTGHIFVRLNEGTNKEPKFATKNVPVLVDGKPVKVDGKVATVRSADWDGDGLMDLVVGSSGGTYQQNDKGGGVFLFRNIGSKEKTEFAKAVTLIEPSPKGHRSAVRPDAGIHPDVYDWNGDGKPDLIVGGYSMWTPAPRELTEDEKARLAVLKQEQADVNAKRTAIYAKAREAMKGVEDPEEAAKKYAEALAEHREEINALNLKIRELSTERGKLEPSAQRVSYTWVYLNDQPVQKTTETSAKGETASRE